MRSLSLVSVLILFLPLSASAQQAVAENQTPDAVEKTQQVDDQPDPAIHGQWSESKNGVRMMAKFLQPNEPSNEIYLLVFAQNCSEEAISIPGFKPVSTLQLGESHSQGDGNLLVTAEPLDGQRPLKQLAMLEERMRPSEKIQPGEIRIHAVRLDLGNKGRMLKRMFHQNENAIQMDTVDGNLSDGRWRLSLSWRPDEQFPIPNGQQKDVEREKVRVDEAWRDVQIDLPPLELDREAPKNNDNRLEQR